MTHPDRLAASLKIVFARKGEGWEASAPWLKSPITAGSWQEAYSKAMKARHG